MYLRNETANDIISMFPEKPLFFHESSGLNHGFIAKFHKGYFKIYPLNSEGKFRIQRYYYHNDIPISDDIVDYYNMRTYLRELH